MLVVVVVAVVVVTVVVGVVVVGVTCVLCPFNQYGYIRRERERGAGSQAGRQTGRQTDRCTKAPCVYTVTPKEMQIIIISLFG